LALIGGWLPWRLRVDAFLLALTDEYPPLWLLGSSSAASGVERLGLDR